MKVHSVKTFLTSFFGTGDILSIENLVKSIGVVLSSSAVSSQTNAIGDGIRQCNVAQTTTATITTRDWQASRYSFRVFLKLNKQTKLFRFLKKSDSILSLSVCLPLCLSVCLSVCLSLCLSISRSLCVSVSLYLNFTRWFHNSFSTFETIWQISLNPDKSKILFKILMLCCNF
jgi:hypothetical protein